MVTNNTCHTLDSNLQQYIFNSKAYHVMLNTAKFENWQLSDNFSRKIVAKTNRLGMIFPQFHFNKLIFSVSPSLTTLLWLMLKCCLTLDVRYATLSVHRTHNALPYVQSLRMSLSKPLGMTFQYLFFCFFRYVHFLLFKTWSLQKHLIFFK